jgi:2-polyprenyl-6-methoxyphenol hydroxylase-like FAD-dependent oxidoreductase
MEATPAPFINAIYDRDPVDQIVWGNVALVGDAAHPTSPHGLRSTNMSIIDADVLGECIIRYGSTRNIADALLEYQSIRSASTSQQVLFSRYLGRIKQGLCLDLHDRRDVSGEFLLQRNMHSFEGHPLNL